MILKRVGMVSGGQKQGYDVFINYLMQRHSFDD
jgi:hypothetical protein